MREIEKRGRDILERNAKLGSDIRKAARSLVDQSRDFAGLPECALVHKADLYALKAALKAERDVYIGDTDSSGTE